MEVMRQTALEVLGLKEGFTQEELNKSFRRLSKVAHPDAGGDENLFRFIMCCKETLANNSNTTNSEKTQQTQKTKNERNQKPEKENVYVELKTLYDIYYFLGEYLEKYDITYIHAIARVYITPCKSKKESKSMTIELRQPFKEFKRLGFVNFATTIIMPETFKRFKKFNVRVEFMGDTFKFKLSRKNPFYIVKYIRILRFNSIIELKFE